MSIRAHHRYPATDEQLIAALLPDVTSLRSTPQPAPMPSLPAPASPRLNNPDRLLLGIARLDRSGRVHELTLLRALGWGPGHELTLDTTDDLIVISSMSGGRHRIDNRSALALPAAARRMCGITSGLPVLLVAAVDEQVLVVHPAASVMRLLAAQYSTLIGTPDVR
jgi:hypothetical protein